MDSGARPACCQSSTDGAEDHRVRADEQPAPEQTLGPPEDSEEKENGTPLPVKPPSVMAAVRMLGLPSHQKVTNRKVLPKLYRTAIWLPHKMSQPGEERRVKSQWIVIYQRVTAEYDDQFLDRYHSDMSDILLTSGLLSAASMSFIVVMESNLSPDTSDTTNGLLAQLVQIRLGNLTAAGSIHADPASTWLPTVLAMRIQMGRIRKLFHELQHSGSY
ncbi:uncharacterized protein F5147DRAFT_657858 [Suillus discolor]|uniref:DUF6535 domain-containing protein n=1 Tax=Suillus discolor TaxID=1912936 RepID=A0A9P7EUI2_9AGAM|nr:uncharacterized protein F5147DRAFT_657858 [Suillus discolor]KAG2091856.1 hypothetical protein F5147DRAFT_657858 [Suillus discolor]